MPTEDHIGDVIAKECFHRKTDHAYAAEIAGLPEDEFHSFLDSGHSQLPVNYSALAELLDFDERKLLGIAKGWEPAAIDLSRWSGLQQIVTEQDFAVNAYLAWDTTTKECAIFDTGWNADTLIAFIRENDLRPTDFFITHSHRDHIADMTRVRKEFPDLHLHADMDGTPDASRNHRDEVIAVGSLKISNHQTTGHAADGVTYVIDGWPNGAPKVAIVGDAIFAGSMGRGNISAEEAKHTAKEAILSLPDDTLICAGHGPLTTVGQEKEHNPFF